jgi:hypothetical protein
MFFSSNARMTAHNFEASFHPTPRTSLRSPLFREQESNMRPAAIPKKPRASAVTIHDQHRTMLHTEIPTYGRKAGIKSLSSSYSARRFQVVGAHIRTLTFS